MFCILGVHADDSGHIDKSLMLFINKHSSSDLAKSLPDLMTHIEAIADFKLNSKVVVADAANDGFFVVYKIGNTSYTRKSFEAILKKYYL